MNSDWDEIKKLASDFQKIQLSSTLQRLSERNCIEIVTLLIEKGLVDVIFTNDGKEYLTPDHLEREILDELFVHGGRVNLVELSKVLNVDLSKINNIAEKIKNENSDIHLMLGQLLDEDYITRIATEINEKLSQNGEINISDLTVQFDLPSDFLQQNVVEKHLGKIIRGRQDPNNPRVVFTQTYVTRCKAKIRGALAAITRPTPITAILQQIQVNEKIFHSLLDEVAPQGNVTSKVSNAVYVPNIYSKMQCDWVNTFYKQNGFIEYDAVSKLGISEPKQFIKKQFPNENVTFLKKCAVGSKIIDLTLLSALNECHSTKSYVDLSTLLPSNMSEDDIEELFSLMLKTKDLPNNFVYLDSTVFSNQYLNDLIQPCYELINQRAKEAIEAGVYQTYLAEKQLANTRHQDADDYVDVKAERREERRRKAASGKSGGGQQGRETKTKSTKKHQRGGDKGGKDDYDDDDDDEFKSTKKSTKVLELISLKDIVKIIEGKLEEEGLEHLSKRIAALYHQQLNQSALQAAHTLYERTPQTNRRQTHASLQEKLNTLLVDVRLYEKGLKLLSADTQLQLVKYLLKTLGNDICNEISLYVANECNLNIKNPTTLNADQRNKIAQDCDPEYRVSLNELNKSLSKNSIDEFVNAAESALKSCSMIIKKVDKKKDKILILQHKEKLCQQLKEATDPAIILHLVALILFTSITGCIIHASGRFVGTIIQFLQTNLNAEQNAKVQEYHDLVLKYLSSGNDTDESKIALEKLETLQKIMYDLATTYEKPGVTKAD